MAIGRQLGRQADDMLEEEFNVFHAMCVQRSMRFD
jgi:hypothetical protein